MNPTTLIESENPIGAPESAQARISRAIIACFHGTRNADDAALDVLRAIDVHGVADISESLCDYVVAMTSMVGDKRILICEGANDLNETRSVLQGGPCFGKLKH